VKKHGRVFSRFGALPGLGGRAFLWLVVWRPGALVFGSCFRCRARCLGGAVVLPGRRAGWLWLGGIAGGARAARGLCFFCCRVRRRWVFVGAAALRFFRCAVRARGAGAAPARAALFSIKYFFSRAAACFFAGVACRGCCVFAIFVRGARRAGCCLWRCFADGEVRAGVFLAARFRA